MIRTGYSFSTAFGHLPDVLSRVQEIKLPAAPIADRNSTFGFVRWTKLCEKAGIRPVYGVELAVVANPGEKKPTPDYWTFLAEDSLTPLHELIASATEGSKKEPSLSYAEALAAKGLIKIAGERCRIELLSPEFSIYLGLSPSVPLGFYNEATRLGYKWIAKTDNLYPRVGDLELYRLALDRRASTQTYSQHIHSDDEWRAAVREKTGADDKALKAALANRTKVLKACKAKLVQAELLKPERAKSLRAMCEDGAKQFNCDLSDKVYSDRLDRELELIAEKKFEDYFYILADMISWAKKQMIVGPARGSSCGSLVCYLLGITSIDPIPYGLIFERFIDVNRLDLPDIDVDFSDVRRDLVFKYIENKYGADRVGRLGTVGMFKAKSALKTAGKSLRVPVWMVERTLDGLVERSSADSRAMNVLEDTLNETDMGKKLLAEYPNIIYAAKMEGHPNTDSQHAAGIMITQEPLTNYVAVDRRSKSIMCDKKDSETLNLLKIDALGLTQLSIFERTLQLIGKPDVTGYLETLPLDDPLAFEVLNRGHFSGIFQFTGYALQYLTTSITVENLEDMISITALARPGPLATGGAAAWIKRRKGEEQPTTIHPMLTEITKDTYGIVIYQETVMNIVRVMGGLSWEDTSAIRKAMSGSMGDEFFRKYWEKFRVGAIANGVDEKIAKEIWDQINTFGSWAFNRSHAVAYGIVSYWCCWLKAHHPVEFAAATLDAQTDPLKQIQMLRELQNEGTDYVPVDPHYSSDKWEIKKDGNKKILVGPLTAIKGIGTVTMLKVLQARAAKKPIPASIEKKLLNAKTEIDTLYPIRDRVRAIHPDMSAKPEPNIASAPTDITKVQPGISGEVLVIAIAKRIAPRNENDAANVQKRGYAFDGPVDALNITLRDDTDEIFSKISRKRYKELNAEAIIARGGAGRAIYAVKGTVPKGFRMIDITRIKYLGDLDGE